MPVPRRFDHDLQVPRVPFREAEKRTADRTVNAGLPFALALGAGFVTFIAVGLIAIGLSLPVKWPLVTAGSVMLLVMAWWLLLLWKDDLLWTIEMITGLDVNLDGQVGEPKIITIEMAAPNQRQMRYLHLPVGVQEQDLQRLCIGLMIQQRPFSEAEWTGRGRPFSRAQFREIRAKMLEAGMVVWKDERHKTQGTELTVFGKQALQRVLESNARTFAHAGEAESRPALPVGEWGDD